MSTFLKTAINPPYHEQFSYCLYHDKKGKETETLQLIVGRSTVQIWRQINDDSKNKDEHPNKGEAFLEYIWSNHIPKDDKENTNEKGDAKKKEHEITKEEIDEIERKLKEIDNSNISEMEKEKRKQNISEKLKRREKVIQGKDIEKFQTVRHACKALVHIRKRYKSKSDAGNYKYESLILSDCDRLIKFILFGYEETAKNKIDYRHVPSNKLWPGKMFLKDDDLDFDKRGWYYMRIMMIFMTIQQLKQLSTFVGGKQNFSFLIIIFYYLAIYQLIIEVKQFRYHGFKKYFGDILNIFDITSIIFPVSIMTIMLYDFHLSDGFGRIIEENDSKLILFLRLNSDIGIYIYCVEIIFRAIIPFFWFMLFVILAFAHSMFILLRDPKNTEKMKIRESTYSGVAKDPSTNGTLYYINLKPDFDPKSSDDNPFSTYYTAIEATYFWMSGNWVQRDKFDNWAVGAFTLIAITYSNLPDILLYYLTFLFSGVYVTAGTKGKRKLLRYQADYIATFEALYVHFSDSELEYEPKHIYYSSPAKNFEEWYNTRKGEQSSIYKDFEETSNIMMSNIFRERIYDNHSLLTYNNNIKKIIENYINSGNDINHDLKDLIERVKDKNSIEEIIKIGNTKNDVKFNIEKLHYMLEKLKLKKKFL
ncbi:hypothetical protein RhiirC2_786047 [Rhizophagus irregularis]|uniref:Ion transport domain-containing protein n=1 Tax=Rhizophagus irregularis TaxID=588596 RepID=A0A2N1MV56_9GLOM|nr:hypothetical protein RhiirC2_786047 [Rhizophagus irregularis]